MILILGAIFTGIVVLVTAIVILLPKLTSVASIRVPETAGSSELDAEKKLIDEGLKINSELKYINSDTIESGLVVKTDPAAGRTVKEGTEVTIYISSGSNSLILEDYTGKNYIDIRARLESTYKLNIIIEPKSVDNPSDYTASEIIGQDPAAGAALNEGGTLTLYIPDIEDLYPDFTTGDYSLTEIQKFAEKYSIVLKVDYVETDEVAAGTIISQSRAAGSKIVAGARFTIKIAQEKQVVEETPTEETNEENGSNN